MISKAQIPGLLHDALQQQRSGDPAEAERLYREILAADPQSAERLLGLGDFYAMSECRDLVFHVQEHQYRLPQIYRMLEAHGLKVIGLSSAVPPHAAAEYRKMFPGDDAMADLEREIVTEECPRRSACRRAPRR